MIPADPRILRLLAELAAYPGPGIASAAGECAAALGAAHSGAAERLLRFAAFAHEPAAAEEAYTSAFDLAPLASPYVGDQLFGESRERALFMAWLRELQPGSPERRAAELPDHLSEVLLLVASPIAADVRDDLVHDALVPAARKMAAALEEARHPYADVLGAMVEALEPASAARADAGGPRGRLEVFR
jgi:nitrate reductase assembly molybdenum cofactor insertion protein NarJ